MKNTHDLSPIFCVPFQIPGYNFTGHSNLCISQPEQGNFIATVVGRHGDSVDASILLYFQGLHWESSWGGAYQSLT